MELRHKITRASKAAAVATAVVLVTNIAPASAAGAGVSVGSTNVNVSQQIQAPLCLKATNTIITLNNTGTFTAGTAVYVGDLQDTVATFSTGIDYWFSPAGTFGNAMCTLPSGAPGTTPISGSLVVNGTNAAGNSVSCSGTAVYNRVGENAQLTTAGNSNTSCTVTVNGVGTTASTVLTFEGVQSPCLGDFNIPEPCGTVPEWVGTYAQS